MSEQEYDYQNLIACCNDSKTCGKAKQNKFHDLFINPVLEEPKHFLIHDPDEGELQPLERDPNTQQYKKAATTMEILNLNEKELKQDRRAWHRKLVYLKGSSKEEFLENLECFSEIKPKPSFPSIIQYHLDNYDAFLKNTK